MRVLPSHCKGEGSDSQSRPLVLVGKGVTFNSGGIALKPSRECSPIFVDVATMTWFVSFSDSTASAY